MTHWGHSLGLMVVAAVSVAACDVDRSRFRGVVESRLKDPSSVQYRNDRIVRHADGRVFYCGEINARNALGGYVGFQLFVADTESVAISQFDGGKAQRAFADLWMNSCYPPVTSPTN